MKNILSTAVLFVSLAFVSASCENSTRSENPADGEAAYFNSFETETDTSGWAGEGLDKLSDDHSPEGGTRALHIAGGCPQPAASFEVSPVKSGNYKLSFWAKMGHTETEQSATVFLGTHKDYENNTTAMVTVTGEEWKYYETENHTFLSSPGILRVEFFVGGFVFADVYIDNLKIGE